jgi:hypothetical protein
MNFAKMRQGENKIHLYQEKGQFTDQYYPDTLIQSCDTCCSFVSLLRVVAIEVEPIVAKGLLPAYSERIRPDRFPRALTSHG